MTENTEPLVTVRGGENSPFWRTREQQLELLNDLIGDALEEAIQEHGHSFHRHSIRARYHSSGLEPQCCYGEVKIYDKYDLE